MGSTPPPPTPSSNQSDDLPRHIPVDMGMAPRVHPYEQHTVSTSPRQQQQPPPPRQHHQHSLSPEQLGVVGYVKDVAGFVKDTVQDIRERRRSSQQQQQQQQVEGGEAETQPPSSPPTKPVSIPPPAQQQLASSPLATIATGMFPGISGSKSPPPVSSPPAPPPCTHADALRQDLREQLQQHSAAADKEHRLL